MKDSGLQFEYAESLNPYEKVVKKIVADDLLEALQAAMDYIDAIPKDIALPAMPGFDRDWVDGVISKALGEE